MLDQLIIGDKHSYDDFEASISARKIGMPEQKKMRETIPYSNITYDFSRINGEIYYEDRELEYSFEMTAETPEKLEDLKAAFSNWITGVFQEELHDPFIPDYHFIATYDSMTYDDEAGLEKTTANVKFTAYPYKIANYKTVYKAAVLSTLPFNISVVNKSSHPVTVNFSGKSSFEVNDGVKNIITEYPEPFVYSKAIGRLECGLRILTISGAKTGDEIEISFAEEVI